MSTPIKSGRWRTILSVYTGTLKTGQVSIESKSSFKGFVFGFAMKAITNVGHAFGMHDQHNRTDM